ncbi:hypothetical protein ACFFX0_13115 [Citricoccus parietis]|uniref:Uncharacterized protein n=1 Tax=Citricoccus parietis TaxID=592307 RepID=A0ABV5G0A5_9MICC
MVERPESTPDSSDGMSGWAAPVRVAVSAAAAEAAPKARAILARRGWRRVEWVGAGRVMTGRSVGSEAVQGGPLRRPRCPTPAGTSPAEGPGRRRAAEMR